MKKIVLFGIILIVFSCSDDDSNSPTYSFTDQDLQGLIDGRPFTIGFGSAMESSFNDGYLSIEMYDQDEEIENVCNVFGFGNEVNIFFDIPETIGVYPLSSGGNTQTVTLFNPTTALNIFASTGAVEIITISNGTVTGRMDVRHDENSYVNGNFTLEVCPTN